MILNSLEHNEAKPCLSSMSTHGVICLPQCLALSIMDEMGWMFFVLQTLLLPWLRPNQPYHQFPEYDMSGTPDCANVSTKLWLNIRQWNQKVAFHPWPEVFGLNTTNAACFVPACKHVLWWSLLSQRCQASWSHCMRLGMSWQDQGMVGTLLYWATWR